MLFFPDPTKIFLNKQNWFDPDHNQERITWFDLISFFSFEQAISKIISSL